MIDGARRGRAGLFTAFAGLGVTAAFVPAILPSVERAMAADLSVAVPALFAGLLVGVLASGPLLMRRPPQTTLILGSALQAAAIAVAALAGTPALFITAAAVAGFGFGLVEASGSVAAKSVAVGSATGLLSALLGTVAVCAAVTPLLIAAGSDTPPVLGVLALVPLLTIVMLAGPSTAFTRSERPTHRDARGLLVLLPFAVALPLYVGVETVLSGWSAVIPERTLALDPGVAALGTSAFWALMAVGRFGAAALRRLTVSPIVILVSATGTAAVLMAAAGFLVESAPGGALVALAVVVVLLAPSYGLILGLALDRLDPARSAAATGALVACGAVGGTFVPTVILLIGRDPASSATFFASAVLCALVPVLMLAAGRAPRKTPATH
ncbi:putative transporter [Microbacterium oxydans]|uniref:Putative transporter n=1 Tax=Microbacterium oxydans TaxID=82380 RepID=A0A0F0KMX0_9MICO|nr:MFS transporter [Microbacterium oxydans]KJL22232.1 putative transporter [Microbacterium oxydans]